MIAQIVQPVIAHPPDNSEAIERVLRTNHRTYERMASVYEKSGAARLIQAQRWLAPLLEPMRQAGQPLRVLELGSADGYLTGYISGEGHHVTAVEYAGAMAEATRRNAPAAKLVQDDFLSCHLPHRFDVIICSAFVHLFPAPWDRVLLEKVRSLLAPAGWAYLATTLHASHTSGYEVKDRGLSRFRTRYTAESFETVVVDAGLNVSSYYQTRDRLSPGKMWGNWLVEREGS